MSERVKVQSKVLALLAELSKEDAARVLQEASVSLDLDTRRARNRERMRTVRAQTNTDDAQLGHQSTLAPSLGGRGDSLSLDSRISDLKNLPLSELSSGDPGHSPGARESGVVPAVAPVVHEGVAPSPGAIIYAYQSGIAEGSQPGTRFAVLPKHREDLLETVKVHGVGPEGPRTGSDLVKWVQFTARDFAGYLRAMPPKEKAERMWTLNPSGFARWLNENPDPLLAQAAVVPAGERANVPMASVHALAGGIGKGGGR